MEIGPNIYAELNLEKVLNQFNKKKKVFRHFFETNEYIY